MNKNEPLLTYRNFHRCHQNREDALSRDKHGGYLMRKECIENPDAGLSFLTVHAVTGIQGAPTHYRLRSGTWEPAFRCKGRNPSIRNARIGVPIRNAGAEQPVVVVIPRNGGGAKGLCYPVMFLNQPKGRSS